MLTPATPILNRLRIERIFCVLPCVETHTVQVEEMCDNWFSVDLTYEDLRTLGQELMALAEYYAQQDPAAPGGREETI